ncbi:MAG TPA: hypothetical protein VFV54_00815, partial [Thermoanaerobaculia bacterium]|nr:hypothetical protein [Thermoanaerobaculia bacterium]
PARVKAALVGGAIAVSGGPFARGAGRIDAERALRASLLLSPAGISFGLSHDATAKEVRTATVTVTNVSASAETFSWNAPTTPPTGIDIAAEPASVELAAGASATITLRLTIDPALRPFSDDVTAGGDVKFNGARGTSSFSIPWAVVRGARATITYDGTSTGLVAFAPNLSRRPYEYGAGEFEMFVKPGASWELMLTGIDIEEGAEFPAALRYLIAEKRAVDGDAVIALRAADASAKLDLAAAGADGRLLRDMPEEGDLQRRFVTARLNFLDGDWKYNTLVQLRGVRAIHVSPVSDRYTLIPFESYVDVTARRGYNVQHRAFRGVAASETLAVGPADYLRATLRWERPEGARELFLACKADANTTSAFFSFWAGGCAGEETSGPVAFEYFTTPETTGDAFAGLIFQDGASTTQTFRGRDGHIIASSEAIPPRTAPAVPSGGEIVLGGGVYFPFAFYGTTAGLPVLWPAPSFIGPFGETLRNDTVPAHWEMFDAQGARLSRGIIDPSRGIVPQGAPGGSRLVVRREWRHQSGLTTSGTLEVAFASASSDLTAPTVTSLRVSNAAGRTVSRLAVGDAATLHVSAGDLDHGKRMEPQPTKTDATRVYYRVAGTANWNPLAIALVDSESGSTNTQRHVPAGDIYRADLKDATRVAALLDLRIELEDLAGNRMTWTQEGALFVGPEGAAPSRARRARRP